MSNGMYMEVPSLLASRLQMVERSARVRRYHTEMPLHPQNVGEHTYGVMWLVWLITEGNASRDLIVATLMHDSPEHATGDIPAPIKRQGGLKTVFDAMEEDYMEQLLLKFPQITDTEARTLKLADCLEGAMFCGSELRRGNREMLRCFRNFVAYIEQLRPEGKALDILNYIKEQHREFCGQ